MTKNKREKAIEVQESKDFEEENSSLDEIEEERNVAAPVVAAPERSRSVTFDPFRLYLEEIKRYPLLSREEERELAIRYREKDDVEAGYRLITANLRLVVKIAMDFQRYWMQNLNDLIQEGNVGLMQAVKKFDPYRGYKFSYYASFWIKAYIIKFIMDNWKLVKIGTTQAQRKLFFNLRKEKERLEAQGIEASTKLLSSRLDVKESEIVEMDQRLNSWEISLDSPLKEDSEDTHKSFLPSDDLPVDDLIADREAKAILHDKLMLFREQLKGKEAVIFDKRLLTEEPLTLQEIGDRFGISRERVRQIESRLKKKLKAYLEEEIEDLDLLQESMIEI
ncbi:sigma-70 family RNA polymerase sigma factor [Desulforhabdus amnigena]|jgi:RNA polymerase sigma-32 factor|uniref:RNA polymerase sigma factor n=1 Tax=Desulforhabdus amnigena TaxID=40218 RepID=A0A9W6FUD7_9BACT|nr:RNA polymerase factor sigma-32 [Desulforhabdus amnigena]NLJ27521.1 RNA polymerase factor sigma-32 [Deltaproteobacteria bacterium]GLI35042.1 RNA polymerase sigma factor [Desulforhabdus amnigena]